MKKLLFIVVLGLVFAMSSFAQTGYVTGIALDGVGNTVAGATVTVCPQGSSGIPCSPVTASTTSNGQGAFSVAVPLGTYTVTVFRTGIISTSSTVVVAPSNITVANNVTYSGSVVFTGSLTVSGTGTFSGTILCKSIEGIHCVDSANSQGWAGTDFFGWLNSAMAAGCPVIAAPGSYGGITTQLVAISNCAIQAYEVTPTFTGSSGPAILIANVTNFRLEGFSDFIGPGTGGTVDGIQLGTSSGSGGDTTKNYLGNMRVRGFRRGLYGTGAAGSGTYWNTIANVFAWQNGSLGNSKGFYLVPAANTYFNDNWFIGDSAQFSVTDGLTLDGATGNHFYGFNSENNSGCGVNIVASNQTNFVSWHGGHLESNTTADWCAGTPANINQWLVNGVADASATECSGGCRAMWVAGTANCFLPQTGTGTCNYTAGTQFGLTVNSSTPAANLFNYFNNESPPSGQNNIFNIARAGADNGSITLGTPEYPLSLPAIKSPLISDRGLGCTNGELALSGGWQSTGSATVTAVAGNGQTCSWTITTGTTTAANPTVTDTLTNSLPDATTVCELNIHGGTHTAVAGEGFTQTTLSATAPVFTFIGTPTANGFTYFVTRRCGP